MCTDVIAIALVSFGLSWVEPIEPPPPTLRILCLSLTSPLSAADLDCLMALSLLAIGLLGVLVAVN